MSTCKNDDGADTIPPGTPPPTKYQTPPTSPKEIKAEEVTLVVCNKTFPSGCQSILLAMYGMTRDISMEVHELETRPRLAHWNTYHDELHLKEDDYEDAEVPLQNRVEWGTLHMLAKKSFNCGSGSLIQPTEASRFISRRWVIEDLSAITLKQFL